VAMTEPIYRTEPVYRRIAEDLRQQIESGELAAGVQLPSEDDLRDHYGHDAKVARNTIRDAIRVLVSRGLVETRPGQGTFVLRKMTPFVTLLTTDPSSGGGEDTVYESEVVRRGRTPEDTLRVEVQVANELVATHLQLGANAQVIIRHQERKIDSTPWSMQTTFYSMELLQKGAAATRLLEARGIDEGAVQYLKDKLGISQVGWRDTILARPPNAGERVFFDLPDKVQAAVFEFRRTGYDEDHKPIRLTVTVYPADRNLFELEAGDVPQHGEAGSIPRQQVT
jgi:GntR family transcriptional regulator